METALQDVRYALRFTPEDTGIHNSGRADPGAGDRRKIAIFSVIEAVMLRALPYRESSRLVLLTDAENSENGGFLYKDFNAFKVQSRGCEDLAIYFRPSKRFETSKGRVLATDK